ncbi:MAG TPA: LamG domain-containing protein [Candidatus Saccharimonadia bacterium]|nr:LamG domain-containing protein [Candidatus Saccharimonadia bacterium]
MIPKARRLWLGAALLLMVWPGAASANLLQSTHFRLDPNVADTFGGTGSSASYKLTDAGGEAVVGSGASQSYKLTQGYVAQLAHSLQLSVLPTGVYASWPLDTGIGTQAYDVSTTGDNGTLQGAPAWTTGKLGQGIVLDGASQYMSTSTTQTSPNTFTLELWFKTTTAQGGRLIGLGDALTGASTNRDRQIYMTNGGQLVFGVNSGSIKTISSTSAYNDGNWHHVAATCGTAGLTLAVDGVRVGTDATTTAGGSYTGSWRLGYDNLIGWPSAPTSSFFAGTLDEARVYSRQLADADIAADYAAGVAGLRSAVVLPSVTPGSSSTGGVDAVVWTDAGGYDLYVQAPKLLTHTDGTTTIPMLAAGIAAPTAWTEGSTKGLGFTVTNGAQVEAKWGIGPSYDYAGLSSAATVYHSRAGFTGGAAEKTSLQYRVDTLPQQKQGSYSTTVVYTATLRP